MINLKLFTALQGKNTASLLLQPADPGKVTYYLMTSSYNYSVATTGECAGDLPDGRPVVFDINLASISPLLDKNFEFKMTYKNATLQFVEIHNRFSVTPFCMERISDFANDVLSKTLSFSKLLSEKVALDEDAENPEFTLENLRDQLRRLENDDGSGWVNSSSPFGEVENVEDREIKIAELKGRIVACNKAIENRRSVMDKVREVDMKKFKRISDSAARVDTVLELTEDYAVHALPNGYVFEKAPCHPRAISGKVLQRLLREKSGVFFETSGNLVFSSVLQGSSEDDVCRTYVFLLPYLPSYKVDGSLITKGAVLEQYHLNIKDMMSAVVPVIGKFTDMSFDLGNSMLVLSNDRGEVLNYKFDVKDAKTLELNRLMRGEAVSNITMSTISVPLDVQRVLPSMGEDFTIFVKKNKVVFQSGTYYVVFGR